MADVIKLHHGVSPSNCMFRNLSSVNERTRQKMREVRGLVDSLVAYVKNALQEDIASDKVP